MAGRVRRLIDELIELRAHKTPALEHFVKVNLLLSGIDPDAYSANSADDPEKVRVLESMIQNFRR